MIVNPVGSIPTRTKKKVIFVILRLILRLRSEGVESAASISAAQCSSTKHAMPPELSAKWRTSALMNSLMCARYSVTL